MKHFKLLLIILFAVNIISLVAHNNTHHTQIDASAINAYDTVGEKDTVDRIYFYLEAAVIMPKSKPAINKIAQTLREHPNMKAYIHGHTNGDHPGMMTIKGRSTNYFQLNDAANVMRFGSAKKLSKERAEVVKAYLVQQGIRKNRIDVIGWGGEQMIYKGDDSNQWLNARAEVEFIEKRPEK